MTVSELLAEYSVTTSGEIKTRNVSEAPLEFLMPIKWGLVCEMIDMKHSAAQTVFTYSLSSPCFKAIVCTHGLKK